MLGFRQAFLVKVFQAKDLRDFAENDISVQGHISSGFLCFDHQSWGRGLMVSAKMGGKIKFCCMRGCVSPVKHHVSCLRHQSTA